jgi:hypothetical protein
LYLALGNSFGHYPLGNSLAILSFLITIEGLDHNSVSQHSPLQYKTFYNSYQLLSTSFVNDSNQEQLDCAQGINFVHYPPFQLIFYLLIDLMQRYYFKFTKHLSLPKSYNLYVVSRKCSVNVLYVHLIPRPSHEYFDMQYWDFRLGNHKGCCIYTSLLIWCTFQHKPRCTISQQQLLILLDQHTIVTLVGVNKVVGMTSATRKPLRTARNPWISLSTCKGEKRRSRISLLLKNE